jgi:hypothetical protein
VGWPQRLPQVTNLKIKSVSENAVCQDLIEQYWKKPFSSAIIAGIRTLRVMGRDEPMLRVFLKWAALLFLVVESLGLIASLLNLALKVSEPNQALPHASLGAIALELILRAAIVGLILSTYLCLRSAARLPRALTRESALLTARAVQRGSLATIGLCALVAETTKAFMEPTPLLSPWIISASAVGTISVGLMLRRKFLSPANGQLRRDPTDVGALRQWRKFTLVSIVLAMAIGMYGSSLRMSGYSRVIEWSFFAGAVLLLFLWRPRLEDATSPPETQERVIP